MPPASISTSEYERGLSVYVSIVEEPESAQAGTEEDKCGFYGSLLSLLLLTKAESNAKARGTGGSQA